MTAVLGAPPPREALKALAARGQSLDPSFHWADIYGAIHAQMFTVAKSAGFDILTDIYNAVQKRIETGQTTKEAIADLIPILQEAGWWGKALQQDPQTGETKLVQLGSPRRLKTIFDVNMRVSYAAGHWASFERNKRDLPYLRYVAVLDRRTRPAHAAQNNVTLPVDDPHWDTWAPPCGWNCRCTLQSLSEADVTRLGSRLIRTAPSTPNRSWTNPRTGEVATLPEGIDPGWGYNPGKAGFRAASAYADKLAAAPPAIAGAASSQPTYPAKALADEFSDWVQSLSDRRPGQQPVARSSYPVGTLDAPTLDALKGIGVEPQSAGIIADQGAITHALRDAKAASGASVPLDVIQRLPEYISAPKAVLWDIRNGTLLYVFDGPEAGDAGKIVVRVNARQKVSQPDGSRSKQIVNSFVTAGIVQANNLTDVKSYRLLAGKLD